jgi:ABC-type spermidine/putrescine transport system permease subunit II
MTEIDDNIKSDKTGIASALLCTVHCLIIPILFLVQYSFTSGNTNIQLPTWWERLDYIFLLISFWAVYHSAGHTRYKEIRIALWLSWTLLAVAIIGGSNLHWLAYIASAGLISAHFVNLKRMRKNTPTFRN